MMCLCPDCSPDPAPTYMPEFRLACEARLVAKRSTVSRHKYMRDVKKLRGEVAAVELIAQIMRETGEDRL